MWRRVDIVWTDVSDEFIASIFRVENSASEGTSVSSWLLSAVARSNQIPRKMEVVKFLATEPIHILQNNYAGFSLKINKIME
jgi:hypothetical protein